ncbi:MAG TPA: winged helix-turn-helix domain-containing protein [Candidatus Treponema faecavium]|nr:winged helix-turn-helix domain-containing protein [Candidatus Treponema faecavium]
MEGLIFGPETKAAHELSALLPKCGAAMVSGGTQIDILFLKIKYTEADFILGDKTSINYDRLDHICFFFQSLYIPVLFIYDADASIRENAENMLRQYKEHYNYKLPHKLRIMMLSLFAILNGRSEYGAMQCSYSYIDTVSVIAEQIQPVKRAAVSAKFTKKLPPAARTLYRFLYMHRNQNITMKQMAYYLWKNAAQSHIRTLYCYIHSIRKCLNDIGKQNKLLVRIRPFVYRLNIPEGQEEAYKYPE